MNIEDLVIRTTLTTRGGGVEIDLSPVGYPGVKMTAYQNYLGGSLLGKVESACNVAWTEDLLKISDKVKRYYHMLTNPDSEWEDIPFELNQSLPTSAY